MDVFQEVCKGTAPGRLGYNLRSGIVGKEKATMMIWSLSEGHCMLKRADIRTAEALQLSRDEAKTRLHVRYRAVQPDWRVMGTARGVCGSALGLQQASESVPGSLQRKATLLDALGILDC